MSAAVVDVNVPIVANGRHPPAGPQCRLACIRALRQARRGLICLDDGGRILAEYRRHLSLSGQPGVGDEFMYWLHRNQATEGTCERVPIHPLPHDDRDFAEFPRDPRLASFDPSDRKYAAVAVASGHSPRILNASDTDWWISREALADHGIDVDSICPELMERS